MQQVGQVNNRRQIKDLRRAGQHSSRVLSEKSTEFAKSASSPEQLIALPHRVTPAA
jgi:hypothetical protein